jgi:hypothetical protein
MFFTCSSQFYVHFSGASGFPVSKVLLTLNLNASECKLSFEEPFFFIFRQSDRMGHLQLFIFQPTAYPNLTQFEQALHVLISIYSSISIQWCTIWLETI